MRLKTINKKLRTGYVKFPGLNLGVKLKENEYFADLGVVKNPEKMSEKIMKKIGVPNYHHSPNKKGYSTHGQTLRIQYSNGDKYALILIKKNTPHFEAFNYGHESTHSLIYLNKEKDFLDLIQSKGVKINPFERLDDEEHIANLGGLIALNNYYPGMYMKGDPKTKKLYEILIENGDFYGKVYPFVKDKSKRKTIEARIFS